jgi:hypothetical protein
LSSGLSFSTTYVASSVAVPSPTFRTECTRSAGTVDDLLARTPVPDRRRGGLDVDPVLNHFPAGDAEILPLEIGADEPRNLLLNGHG